MTDPAIDIAKFLNSKSGGWWDELKMRSDVTVPGTNNLFYHDLPDKPDFAVAVLNYEGQPPVETFGNPLLVRRPRVQVTVRHESSAVALERARDILRVLVRTKDFVINGTTYQRITAVGEPNEVGPDSKTRERVTVNFQVAYYDNEGIPQTNGENIFEGFGPPPADLGWEIDDYYINLSNGDLYRNEEG
jgi:hypothetical protein